MRKERKSGFTLIEAVVYLAIVSVVLVAVIGFSQRIISAYTKSKTIQEVQQGARFALGRIAQDIRSCQSINADSTVDYLHLDALSDSDDIYYQITDGQLMRSIGTASAVAVTSSNLEVQDLTVIEMANTVISPSYQIEFSLKYNNSNNLPEYDWQQDFTTTINIRHGN